MCWGSGHLLAKGNSSSEPSSSVVPVLIVVMLGGGVRWREDTFVLMVMQYLVG